MKNFREFVSGETFSTLNESNKDIVEANVNQKVGDFALNKDGKQTKAKIIVKEGKLLVTAVDQGNSYTITRFSAYERSADMVEVFKLEIEALKKLF